MAEVVREHKIAGFFCADPLELLKSPSGRGRRVDIKDLCRRCSSYEEALALDPDTVARGCQVVRQYFQL